MELSVKDIITLLQTIGFPIFIAVWFLLRTERIMQASTDAINRLIIIEEREIEVLRVVMLKYGIPPSELGVAISTLKEKLTP